MGTLFSLPISAPGEAGCRCPPHYPSDPSLPFIAPAFLPLSALLQLFLNSGTSMGMPVHCSVKLHNQMRGFQSRRQIKRQGQDVEDG